MHPRLEQAETLYDALFDWQPPLSLWERSESLKRLLGDELLASRDVGRMEIKRILEGWVSGKSLTMAYHGEPCLVRVAHVASMDAQIYRGHGVESVEVTQALYPGRKRNVFAGRGDLLLEPLGAHERAEFGRYRDVFLRQAFLQVEARIEHKFNLYKALDYLLVYVDLFDAQHPRFSMFALQEFADEHEDELEARMQRKFRARWCDKIGHLFLLGDRSDGSLTRFAPRSVLTTTQNHVLPA